MSEEKNIYFSLIPGLSVVSCMHVGKRNQAFKIISKTTSDASLEGGRGVRASGEMLVLGSMGRSDPGNDTRVVRGGQLWKWSEGE